ncbi:MAG: GAF domain-containing sensor histidine kinase [Desulfobacteraceae bacterium]|jgi:signal transduction histidine kinase
MSEEKLYNSVIVENYIQLAKYKYPDLNTDEILLEAGIEPWDLDPGNWFSQKQVDRFQNIIVDKTGNPDIAREAGQYSVADRSGNLIRQAALSLLSPSNLLDIIGKITSKVTKASTTSSKKISKNKYEIIVEYSPGVKPKKYQCLSTQGYLEAVYFVFCSRFPQIEHVECFFENGEKCRYIMSWDPTVPQMLKSVRNLLFLVTAVLIFLSIALNFSIYAPVATLILSLLAFLAAVYYEKTDLLSTLKKQNFGPHTVLDGHNRFHRSANLIAEVSGALSRNTTVKEVMLSVGNILAGLGYPSGLIILLDYERNQPTYKEAYCFGSHGNRFLSDLNEKKVSTPVFHDRLRKPIMKDIEKTNQLFPKEVLHAISDTGIHFELYLPILFEKSLIGFIFLQQDYLKTMQAIDLHLLNTIASQTALSVTNISFYNSLLKSESLKRDFVTAASHEMLTPIQIINLAYQEIGLTLSKYRLVNPELSESLSILDEAVKKLNLVSANVLNFDKLESELELLPVKFDILIEEIKKKTHYIPSTFNHSIQFSIDDKIDTIECHKNAFVQMVSNLIENSAKYSPHGGRIDVACDVGPAGLTIAVTDNGIGIPKECHEKIFMKFYQVNDVEGGCGLGLAFCQETVKQHGGYISVESPVFPERKRRKGTRFIVHIPCKK